jgi:hypothetical protein
VNADGIRILSIYPGRTATPKIKALCEITGRPYEPELLLQPGDIAQIVVDTLRLPRTAEVTSKYGQRSDPTNHGLAINRERRPNRPSCHGTCVPMRFPHSLAPLFLQIEQIILAHIQPLLFQSRLGCDAGRRH